MAFAARQMVSSWAGMSGKAAVKIDLRNAFNVVDRSALLAEVAAHFPSLLPYATAAHGAPTLLAFGDADLFSAAGVQQGDPLGPLFFALVMRRVWMRADGWAAAAGVSPLDVRAAYLDDLFFGGDVDATRAYFDFFSDAAAEVGLELNLRKCEVISDDPECLARFPDISTHRSTASWELLGTPCGHSRDAAEAFVEKALRPATDKMRSLAQLPEPHVAFTLLRYCGSFPSAVFFARTVGPVPAYIAFDEAARAAAEATTMLMPDSQWAQATLPTRLGGLGLRQVAPHAPLAFAACNTSAQTMLPLFCNEGLIATIPPDPWLIPAVNDPSLRTFPLVSNTLAEFLRRESTIEWGKASQKKLSRVLDGEVRAALLADAPLEKKARFASCSAPHASAWVAPFATALSGEPQFLDAAQFVVLVRHRLGLPVLPCAAPCSGCKGRTIVDTAGSHSLTCLAGGCRHRFHNALRRAITMLASSALMGPAEEAMPFEDGSFRRVDVLLRDDCAPFRGIAIDVSVVFPLQPSFIRRAADSPGGAATAKEAVKNRAYEAACSAANIRLVPVIVDTWGAWGKAAIPLIRMLARKAGEREDLHPAESVPRAFTRLSVLVQSHIATLLMANASAADDLLQKRAAAATTSSAPDADAAEDEEEEDELDDAAHADEDVAAASTTTFCLSVHSASSLHPSTLALDGDGVAGPHAAPMAASMPMTFVGEEVAVDDAAAAAAPAADGRGG